MATVILRYLICVKVHMRYDGTVEHQVRNNTRPTVDWAHLTLRCQVTHPAANIASFTLSAANYAGFTKPRPNAANSAGFSSIS